MENKDNIGITKELIGRAYACACEKGFHDKPLSIEHMLMLVLTEICEAVEADRHGRYAELKAYHKTLFVDNLAFETYIKDTVNDELADVCIRIYDMCGVLDIEPRVEYDSCVEDFVEIFGEDSFAERMYYLSRMLCSTNGQIMDDGTDECLPNVFGQALSFLFSMCNSMNVDLMEHIRLKMSYNETRPEKHGKKY